MSVQSVCKACARHEVCARRAEVSEMRVHSMYEVCARHDAFGGEKRVQSVCEVSARHEACARHVEVSEMCVHSMYEVCARHDACGGVRDACAKRVGGTCEARGVWMCPRCVSIVRTRRVQGTTRVEVSEMRVHSVYKVCARHDTCGGVRCVSKACARHVQGMRHVRGMRRCPRCVSKVCMRRV